MAKIQKRRGPKPVTVFLHPLKAEDALAAFMAVDPKRVEKRFKAFLGRNRRKR
jgi:hypothetical protein